MDQKLKKGVTHQSCCTGCGEALKRIKNGKETMSPRARDERFFCAHHVREVTLFSFIFTFFFHFFITSRT
jgi:hypothetical protein